MRHFRLTPLLPLLLTLSLLASPSSSQAQRKHTRNVEAYMERCNLLVGEPVIVAMADTLREMSLEVGDTEGIVAAPVLPFHYYLQSAQEDSMDHYATLARETALEYGRMDYYYMVWERWISYQIVRHRYSIALRELDQMHAMALENNHPEGLLSCYKNLCLVHYYRAEYDQALSHARSAIQASQRIKDNDYETGLCYIELCRILSKMGRHQEAVEELQHIMPILDHRLRTAGENDMMMALLGSMLTSAKVALGDLKGASDALSLVDAHMHNGYHYYDIMRAHSDYYCALGHYTEALEWQKNFYNALGTTHTLNYYKDMSEILMHIPGREREAAQLAHEYVRFADSVQAVEHEAHYAEVDADMEIYRLEAEKQQLHLRAMQALWMATLLLLATCVAFTLYTRRQQRRAASQPSTHEASDMLRHDFPDNERLEINATLLPGKQEEGGDFYDYHLAPDGSLLFVLGHSQHHPDVATYIFRTEAPQGASPEAIMRRYSQEGMADKALIGRLDPNQGLLRLCNAGLQHPEGMTRHGDPLAPFTLRTTTLASNPTLGSPNAIFHSTDLKMQPADRFFLHTDIDLNLTPILTTNANSNTQEIVDLVAHRLQTRENDITLLAIVFKQ